MSFLVESDDFSAMEAAVLRLADAMTDPNPATTWPAPCPMLRAMERCLRTIGDRSPWSTLSFVALLIGCAGAPTPVESTGSASADTEPTQTAEREPLASTPTPTETDQERAAAALERLVEACRAGEIDAAAACIVDRGPGAPPWSRATDASDPAARRQVEGICGRIVGDLRGGAYERLGYEKARQGEGLWHVWQVRYAATGEQAVFAFLDIDGVMLLGDID